VPWNALCSSKTLARAAVPAFMPNRLSLSPGNLETCNGLFSSTDLLKVISSEAAIQMVYEGQESQSRLELASDSAVLKRVTVRTVTSSVWPKSIAFFEASFALGLVENRFRVRPNPNSSPD
jgi:hypothetical protein